MFVLPFLCFLLTEAAIIRTPSGTARSDPTAEETVWVFKNIPYAQPPIGDLRFELPADVESWTTDNRSDIVCPQAGHKWSQSEDCLLLDVYVKKDIRNTVPVLVYLHGGHFSSGSKNEYQAEFLVAQQNIIVVIPNYRIGILGTGNLGMWDQRHALKWVQENIAFFSGDPEKVTIAGHDAGAVSVGLHILSPHSQGLFRAAISASGTVFKPGLFKHVAAGPVAEKVGCDQDDVQWWKTCDVHNFLAAQKNMKKVHFYPKVDGNFVPDTPDKLYRVSDSFLNVSYLAGVTRNEASLYLSTHFLKAIKHKHLDHIIEHLLEPYLSGTPDLKIISKAVKYHYLKGLTIPSFESVQPHMEMMLTDFVYNSPLHKTLYLHSLRNVDTYMYVFEFANPHSPLGAVHMLDAFYLFNKTFEEWRPNFKVAAMRKTLCAIWGHFVKTRSPGHPSLWKRFRHLQDTNYAEISSRILHKTNYRRNAIDFWNILVPDLKYYHNLSSDLPQEQSYLSDQPKDVGWGVAGMCVMLMALCVAMVGTVTMTRRRYAHSSIIPMSRDDLKYSTIVH